MRTWELLAKEAELLKNQTYHWPSDFPEQTQRVLESFDRLCITRLETLLSSSLSDRNKNKKIRRFFIMRWTVIANTSLDYTVNPRLPSNAWYMAIATHIAEADEAIIKIIMPTIEKVIGAGMDDDIRASTELLNRRIELQNYILNANQDSLISVDDVFNYARQDTHYLFPIVPLSSGDDAQSLAEQNKLLFPLTASDRGALRQITLEASCFFDLLKQIHTVRHNQKPSVGYALFELHEALLRSSKIESGADVAANLSECHQPILDFYRVWVSLADKDKNTISNYRIEGGRTTLHSFLLTLFAHTPGIELSASDFAAVDWHMVPCTHVIGGQLRTLLAQHVNLKNIPLPGREADFYHDVVPADHLLSEAHEKCILSLSQRKVTAGKNDAKITSYEPFFAAFTDNLLENADVARQILNTQSKIKTIVDLKYPLLLLPEDKWNHLLLLSRDCILTQVIDRDVEVVQAEAVLFIMQILQSIPPQLWKSFFNAMTSQNCDFFLSGDSLANLLYEFNESSWKEIVSAMGRYPDLILCTPENIALLLKATHVEHYQIISKLFHAPIASVLNTPGDYAALFAATSREIWHPIFSLFSQTLMSYIQNEKFINEVFEAVDPDRRLTLVTLIVRSGVPQADIIKNLHHILPRLEWTEWSELFRITRINHRDKDFLTPLKLILFLNKLNYTSWSDLNILFRDNINALILNPENLGLILMSIPEANWKCFFEEFCRSVTVSADYLLNCLSKISSEKRIKIIEYMFNKISDPLLSTVRLADFLNFLSVDNWPVFFQLVEKRYPWFFNAKIPDFDKLINKIPVEQWTLLKNIFGVRFDNAFRDETSLILCARELPAEKISVFFLLTAHLVQKHITSINFLKTIVYHVRNEKIAQCIALAITATKVQAHPGVNPFPMDNLSDVVTVFSRVESVQKNNTNLVLEIIGKPEIIHYLRTVLPFSAHDDLTQLSSWEALYASTPAIVPLFLDSAISFALIFHTVSVDEWPSMARLLSKSLTHKLHDCLFLRLILLYLSPDARSSFCEAVFPFVNPPSISLGIFAPVFSVLPKNDWMHFYSIIKTRKVPLFLKNVNDFYSLLNEKDFDSFDAWYALLDLQVDLLFKRPSDIKNLFSRLDMELWPKVAIRCNQMLIDHFEKIDFLKDTVAAFPKENRFAFLKSLATFFDDMPINAVMLMNMLKLIPFSQWADFLVLFGKRHLHRAITNESDLLLILNGVENYRCELLSMIQDQLPTIRCDHPMQFMHLLKSFPEMQNSILGLFKRNFADVLNRFISHFMLVDDSREATGDVTTQICFDYLVEKFLPILLSTEYLTEVLRSESEEDLAILQKLFEIPDSSDHENDLLRGRYSDANYYRLAVLGAFIEEVKQDALSEKSQQEITQFKLRARVYSKLVAHFGSYFFEKIRQYASCVNQYHAGQLSMHPLRASLFPPGIRPNRVVLFPQRSDAPREMMVSAVARLFPLMTPLQQNAGAAAHPPAAFLENLFQTLPRPR